MALSNVTTGTPVTNQSAGGLSSLATGSISPSSDCLLFLFGIIDADVNTTITVTTTLANVGTWTVHQRTHASPDVGTYTFVAYAKVTGAPGSGTITASVDQAGSDAAVLIPGWLTGHDTTTPVPQTIVSATNTTTTASATLGSTPATTSEVIGVVGRFATANSAATMAPAAGFTEAAQQFIWNSTYSFGIEIEIQYQNGGSPPAAISATTLGSIESWAAIAVEIAQSGGAPFVAAPRQLIRPVAVRRAAGW